MENKRVIVATVILALCVTLNIDVIASGQQPPVVTPLPPTKNQKPAIEPMPNANADLAIRSFTENRIELDLGVLPSQSGVPTRHLSLVYFLDRESGKWIATVSQLPSNPREGRTEIARFEYQSTRTTEKTWQVQATTRFAGKTLAYSTNVGSMVDPLFLRRSQGSSWTYPPTAISAPYIPDGLKYLKRSAKIAYEHPDRDAYNLNPKDYRVIAGQRFYHVQFSKNLDILLGLPPQILGLTIGAALGFLVTPLDPVSKVAGVFIGSVIGTTITTTWSYGSAQYLKDEDGAIWLWMKKSDWDAILSAMNNYEPRTVEYMKIGDLPPFHFTLPVGNPQFIGGA